MVDFRQNGSSSHLMIRTLFAMARRIEPGNSESVPRQPVIAAAEKLSSLLCEAVHRLARDAVALDLHVCHAVEVAEQGFQNLGRSQWAQAAYGA